MGAQTIHPIELVQRLWNRSTEGDVSAGSAATKSSSSSSSQQDAARGVEKVFKEARQALAARLQPAADHPLVYNTARVFRRVSGQVETQVKLDHLAKKLIALDAKMAGLKGQIAELENPNLVSELALSFADEASLAARGAGLLALRQQYQVLQQEYIGLRRQIEKVSLRGMDGADFYERNLHVAKTFERIGDPDAAAFYYRQILTIRPQLSEFQYATVAHALASLSFAKSLGASSKELSRKPEPAEAEKLLAAVVRDLSDSENNNRHQLYGLLADPLVRDEALSWVSGYYDLPLAQLQILRARLHEAEGEFGPAAVLLGNVSERASENPQLKPYAAEARLHRAQLLFAQGDVASGHRLLNQVLVKESDPHVLSSALLMQGMQMATAGERKAAMKILRGIQSDYPGSRADIFLRSSPLFKEVRSGLGFINGDPEDLLAAKTSPAQKAMAISLSVAMLVPAARAVGWTSRVALEGAELAFGKESIAYALARLGITAAQPLATYTLYQGESSLFLDQPFRWEAGEAMRFAGAAALGGVLGRLDLGRKVATLPLFTSGNARLYPIHPAPGIIDYTSRAGQVAGSVTNVAVHHGAMLLAGGSQDPLDYLGGRLIGSAAGRVISGAIDTMPRLSGFTRGPSGFVVGGRQFVREQNALALYGGTGSASSPSRQDLVGLSLFLEGEIALAANEIPPALFNPEELAANGPWEGDNVLRLPVSYPALAEYSLQLAAGAEELSDSPYVAGGMVPGVTLAMGQGRGTGQQTPVPMPLAHEIKQVRIGRTSPSDSADAIGDTGQELLHDSLLRDANGILRLADRMAGEENLALIRANQSTWGINQGDVGRFLEGITKLKRYLGVLENSISPETSSSALTLIGVEGSSTGSSSANVANIMYPVVESLKGNSVFKLLSSYEEALVNANGTFYPVETVLMNLEIQKIGNYQRRFLPFSALKPENVFLGKVNLKSGDLLHYEVSLPGPDSLARLITELAENGVSAVDIAEEGGAARFRMSFTQEGRTEEALLVVRYFSRKDPVRIAQRERYLINQSIFGVNQENSQLREGILRLFPGDKSENVKSLLNRLEKQQFIIAEIYSRYSDLSPNEEVRTKQEKGIADALVEYRKKAEELDLEVARLITSETSDISVVNERTRLIGKLERNAAEKAELEIRVLVLSRQIEEIEDRRQN